MGKGNVCTTLGPMLEAVDVASSMDGLNGTPCCGLLNVMDNDGGQI